MGELSEQNRALIERTIGINTIDLHRAPLGQFLDTVWRHIGPLLDAARAEGPTPSYDGGKSLGERFYEGLVSATSYAMEPWRNVPDMLKSRYERAALTFTASLSDASPSSGDE